MGGFLGKIGNFCSQTAVDLLLGQLHHFLVQLLKLADLLVEYRTGETAKGIIVIYRADDQCGADGFVICIQHLLMGKALAVGIGDIGKPVVFCFLGDGIPCDPILQSVGIGQNIVADTALPEEQILAGFVSLNGKQTIKGIPVCAETVPDT